MLIRTFVVINDPTDLIFFSDTGVKAEGSSGDVIVDTVRRIDKLFNCIILLITASFIIYVGSVYILGKLTLCILGNFSCFSVVY